MLLRNTVSSFVLLLQVSDFGLSRVVDAMSGSASPDKHGIGALTHAAPELLTGMPLTMSCDVYSVGVLLWELVTGNVSIIIMKAASGTRLSAMAQASYMQHSRQH